MAQPSPPSTTPPLRRVIMVRYAPPPLPRVTAPNCMPASVAILHNVAVGTVPFILGLVVALVISGQLLMLMERHRPIDKRLRDLGWGGDAFALLLVGMLTMGAAGAVVGSLFSAPGGGGLVGLVLALLLWSAVVIWAHRQPQPPARHQRSER
jgi:hypothetical protein